MLASSAHVTFGLGIYGEGWRAVWEIPNLADEDFTEKITNSACLTWINIKWSKSWLTPKAIYINSLTILVKTCPPFWMLYALSVHWVHRLCGSLEFLLAVEICLDSRISGIHVQLWSNSSPFPPSCAPLSQAAFVWALFGWGLGRARLCAYCFALAFDASSKAVWAFVSVFLQL